MLQLDTREDEQVLGSAWMRGFTLEELRAYAEPFRRQHKPHVFGAFGLIKERDVAEALASNSLLFRRRPSDGSISAAAIAKRLSRDSLHRDFADRAIPIYAGSIYVRAFACTEIREGVKILDKLRAEPAGPCVWVEAFEEDRNSRGALDASGFTYITTKIAAGSEIKGLYSNTRRTIPKLDAAELATLEVMRRDFLTVEEHEAILDELCAFDINGPWAQHYSTYNRRKSWTAFALRGYDAEDAKFIISPREMSEAWKKENPGRLNARPAMTPAASHFPAALAAVSRIPGPKDRVRFMRLSPQGELTRHADIVDRQAGVADGRVARLHIPIRTNPSVHFMGWDARGVKLEREFPERALCYLDQRKPHAVRNDDPEAQRLHLVVDAVAGPELRAMLAGS